MPAWRNTDALRYALAALWFASALAYADFKITELEPRLADGTLTLNGELDLSLSPKVEEALSKGIELPLVIEVRLYQKRSFWWDRRIESWALRRRLHYHALTGQYLVSTESGDDSFLSLPNALRSLGRMSDMRLMVDGDTPLSTGDYSVRVRVHLDIEDLPAPLRPVAYTNLSWHLNSGWTEWNVSRQD